MKYIGKYLSAEILLSRECITTIETIIIVYITSPTNKVIPQIFRIVFMLVVSAVTSVSFAVYNRLANSFFLLNSILYEGHV